MKVSEIFYSLQGEGARAGAPSIFIRLSGCKAKNACYAAGIKCDTEFESGKEMAPEAIIEYIQQFPCKEIVWTGGEPLDQLTAPIVNLFRASGYYQCVETSGLHPIPEGCSFDFVSVSPKVAEHVIKKNFARVSELRYVRHAGQDIPEPSIEADYYFVSPHSDGFTINDTNLKHCIDLCLKNPKWRMSVQQHKIWKVL